MDIHNYPPGETSCDCSSTGKFKSIDRWPSKTKGSTRDTPPHTHTHTHTAFIKKKTCELNCNSFKNLWFSERGWMLPITIKCDSCIMCINDTHSNTQCDIHRSLVFSSGCRVSHKQDCALCVWSLVSECEK